MKTFQTFEQRLAAAGNGNAKRSVEELAAYVLGCKPLDIYFRDLTPDQAEELEKLIGRAVDGEPIQYIIGHVDFRGLEIRCDRRALIPRPETEILVDTVLSSIGNRQSAIRIIDVGCGTGCIGLALLAELPPATVTAVDVSSEALALARENAERLGLADRYAAVAGNLLAGVADQSADVVVSNPPYILTEVCQALERSVKDFEPMLALDGGADGLDLVRPLTVQAAQVLKPGGGLFLEIGYDQGEATARCLKKNGFSDVRVVKDLAGLDRIVCGAKR